jgi:hypothetical protein
MIVLVESRGPCVAAGTGRATQICNGSIGAFGVANPPAFCWAQQGSALGIEFSTQDKLNDLGCETVALPCVRGPRNLSSLIKGVPRLAVGNRPE